MPRPTQGMIEEANRGLEWRREYGRGGTEVGVARARDISNNRDLSMDTVRRMRSYFARHEVDKEGQGWSPGESGYPSAGRIAWALWGGDPGKAWSTRIIEAEDGKMSSNLETKDFTFKMTDLTDDGSFAGYASVFKEDSVGDTIQPGAFKRTLNSWQAKGRPIPVLWQHKADEPIGVTTMAMEDDYGLRVEGRLLMALQRAREAHEAAKANILGGLSIGFSIPKDGAERMTDGRRTIKEVKLYEYSFVTFPANEHAVLTSVKSEGDTLREIADLLHDIKQDLKTAPAALSSIVDEPAPASELSTLLAEIRKYR